MASLIYLFNIKCQEKNKILKTIKKSLWETSRLYPHSEDYWKEENFLLSEKVVIKQKTTLIIYVFPLQFQEIIYKVV